jgi:hypothetical protein
MVKFLKRCDINLPEIKIMITQIVRETKTPQQEIFQRHEARVEHLGRQQKLRWDFSFDPRFLSVFQNATINGLYSGESREHVRQGSRYDRFLAETKMAIRKFHLWTVERRCYDADNSAYRTCASDAAHGLFELMQVLGGELSELPGFRNTRGKINPGVFPFNLGQACIVSPINELDVPFEDINAATAGIWEEYSSSRPRFQCSGHTILIIFNL